MPLRLSLLSITISSNSLNALPPPPNPVTCARHHHLHRRKLTFGEVYWTAVSKQRVEFSGKNTNVFELMGEHGKEYIMSMAKGAKSGSHKIKSSWVRRTVDKLTTLDDSSSGGTKAMTLTPKGKKAAPGAGSNSPRMKPGQFKRQDSSRGGDAFGDSTAEPQHSKFKPTL
jgi:hypothetical protein